MNNKSPSLFSAISLGVGSVIGSGWLFACYYAAKDAGPGAIFSWILCAILNLLLSLLLIDIAIKHPAKSLFSRLLNISHNPSIGFVIAATNWLTMIMLIPSEATATVQYVSTLYPVLTATFYENGNLSGDGMLVTIILIIIYAIINYLGIRILTRVNNIITIIKLVVPIITSITIMIVAFHPENFTSYRGTMIPYGVDKIFTTIITSGMFYTFSCFYLVTTFAQELKNPKKTLPLALSLSTIFSLIVFIFLQIAFIGAMNPSNVANGWHSLNFTSPLAQLAEIVGLNWLALTLYADAILSPAGAGIIYTGVATRMLNGMADDKQVSKVFSKLHRKYNVSHNSLFASIAFSIFLVFFFNNWHKIMIASSVFILLGALAIPISFAKLNLKGRNPRNKLIKTSSQIASIACFYLISYLLINSGTEALTIALVLEIAIFAIYIFNSKKYFGKLVFNQIMSAWTIFAYLVVIGFLSEMKDASQVSSKTFLVTFIVVISTCYILLLKQENYK